MGIYIPDMGIPKDGYRQLFLTAEGEVIYFPSTPKNGEVRKKAIVVPNHGDLIDRDALIKDGWLNLHKEVIRMGGYAIHELPLKNPSIPVIIQADREEAT